MNKLIKGAAFAVCAGAMLVFTGCGGSGSPKDLALEQVKCQAQAMGVSGVEFKVVEEKVDGDMATVKIESFVAGKKSDDFKYLYKKVDGKWVIQD